MRSDDFDKTKVDNTGGTKVYKSMIRENENLEYKKAADEYERIARGGYENPRERRLNTGGKSGNHSYYDSRHAEPEIYDGYERSGRAYDQGYSNSHNSEYVSSEYSSPEEEFRAIRERTKLKDVVKEAEMEERAEYRRKKRAKKLAKKEKKQGKKKKKGRKFVKFLIFILILFAAFCAYFFVLASHLDKVDTSNKDLGIDPGVADELSGYRNIAVLGSDARGDESLDGSRTDAIIILSIKKSNGDINMISIMRDSYLKLENANKELVLDKITHAHHWAGGPGTIAALNRSLDLNIKEFVIFNWQAVCDTVDTLGGVTVDIKKNEIRDLNKWGPETARNVGGKYHKITETGKQEIDGVQATTYCRIRKTSGGDPGRGQRYKKIMAAVMKKGITHPWKLNALSKEVFPNIRTNMSNPGMLWAVLRAPGYDIKKSYGWPKKYYGGILSNGLWYAVPRTLESEVKALHKKAFEQDNYTPSDTCMEINNEIINQTGIQ